DLPDYAALQRVGLEDGKRPLGRHGAWHLTRSSAKFNASSRRRAMSEARGGESHQLADVLVGEIEPGSEEEVTAGHDPGHVRRFDPGRIDQIVGAGGDQQV